MSVLEKVSPERRRKTGWILPVALSVGLTAHAPGTSAGLERAEQLWLGGLGLVGVVAGIVWQLYSPRELVERLSFAAGAFVVIALLLLFPVGGEWTQSDRHLFLWCGVFAGLVLASRWQRSRAD